MRYQQVKLFTLWQLPTTLSLSHTNQLPIPNSFARYGRLVTMTETAATIVQLLSFLLLLVQEHQDPLSFIFHRPTFITIERPMQIHLNSSEVWVNLDSDLSREEQIRDVWTSDRFSPQTNTAASTTEANCEWTALAQLTPSRNPKTFRLFETVLMSPADCSFMKSRWCREDTN